MQGQTKEELSYTPNMPNNCLWLVHAQGSGLLLLLAPGDIQGIDPAAALLGIHCTA